MTNEKLRSIKVGEGDPNTLIWKCPVCGTPMNYSKIDQTRGESRYEEAAGRVAISDGKDLRVCGLDCAWTVFTAERIALEHRRALNR